MPSELTRFTARAYTLTAELLLQHRAGQVIALAPEAIGRSFSLLARRPQGYELRRADGFPLVEDENEGKAQNEIVEAGSLVAVVSVYGPLMQRATYQVCEGWIDGYDALAERFAAACADVRVGGIKMRCDSPGGDVAGLEEGVARMLAAKAMSAKPVVAYVDELAASAMYWIAAAVADEVYLPASGAVGSIGCRAMHVDMSKAIAAAGLKPTFISEPAGKVAGNPTEPLSKLGLKRFTRDVQSAANRFFAAMAEAREMKLAAVRALDGDVLSGSAAVSAGLADGVASFEEVIALVAARAAAAREDAMPKTKNKKAADEEQDDDEAKAKKAEEEEDDEDASSSAADDGEDAEDDEEDEDESDDAEDDEDASADEAPPSSKDSKRSKGKSKAAASGFSAAMLAAAGLPPDTRAVVAEPVILAQLKLAAAVIKGVGETDPAKAKGKLAAALEQAAAAGDLRKELEVKSAKADKLHRAKLVETAVSDGRLRAGQAWAQVKGKDGKRTKSLKPWLSSQSTPELEGYLSGLPRLHSGAREDEADTTEADAAHAARGAGLTPGVAAMTKRHGIDPGVLVMNTAMLFGRSAAVEE